MRRKSATGKDFFDLKGQNQFNVQQYAASGSTELAPYSRRDYYKISVVIGKSTSIHISERILNEARALLKHTDWSVSAIAFSLGFEYPTYFNNFFKKNTGVTPRSIRK